MAEGRWSFERGDKVRILEGPYRGLEGVVDRVGEERLHVLVPVSGRHRGSSWPWAASGRSN